MNSVINLPFGLTEEKKKNFKRQYWFIEIYPDSVKENYIDILAQTQYKMAVSPLHDKDYGDDGELLKPHKHILIDFGGGAKSQQVIDIANLVNAKSDVMWVGNKRGAFDYLIHDNDKDKYQYSFNDITLINSVLTDWVNTGYKEVLNIIDDNKIYSFSKLTKYLRKEQNDYVLEYVSQNSYYVNTYIKDVYKEVHGDLSSAYTLLKKIVRDYDLSKYIDSEQLKGLMVSMEKLGLEFDIKV